MEFIVDAQNIIKSVNSHNKKQPDINILRDVNFLATAGEFVSILGPSGSGKTTLLRCISGLTRPTSGQVTIAGKSLITSSERQLARLRRTTISYIFQSYNLLPALPAYDNIVLPLRLSHQKVNRHDVKKLMDDFNFQAALSQYPAELSGGEQQKVAIARALMMHAKVIFADEPTGALDSLSRQLIFSKLRELTKLGVCVVMVTHDIEQASQTDRSLILRDGRLVQEFNHPSEQALLKAMHLAEKVLS